MKTYKYKDWTPGENRIKLDMVLSDGSRITFYIPHVDPDDGHKLLELATQIATSPEYEASTYPKLRGGGKSVVAKKKQ